MHKNYRKYKKQDIEAEYLKRGSKCSRYTETKNKELFNYIEEKIKLNILHKEKVYCYLHGLYDTANTAPKCKNPHCSTSKSPKFQNFKSGYKDFCSVSDRKSVV